MFSNLDIFASYLSQERYFEIFEQLVKKRYLNIFVILKLSLINCSCIEAPDPDPYAQILLGFFKFVLWLTLHYAIEYLVLVAVFIKIPQITFLLLNRLFIT